MKFSRVHVETIQYELPPNVVTSAAIEDRLTPFYETLKLPFGQLEALTGVKERRLWNPDQKVSDGAVKAARKALAAAEISPADVGMLIYGGVCRDNLEPATACTVADALSVTGVAEIYDVSNACLGVLNGMVQVASAIQLGHIKAGLVVSCESARQIIDLTIERLLNNVNMETYGKCLATLTGGSGAIAVLLTDQSISRSDRRLIGGVIRSATEYHRLCRWGPDTGIPATSPQTMETDAPAVLKHGVDLGTRTWQAFLPEMGWPADRLDKVICHQVGSVHQQTILQAFGIPRQREFCTYQFLGNVGTVSLPITAAIAHERGFLQSGDRVGFLGIGSGLNCLMLGLHW